MKAFFEQSKMYLIAIITFLVVGLAYFFPQTDGKVLKQGDLVQNTAMKQEHKEHFEKYNEKSLWTNSMFAGMPMYQIAAGSEGNWYSKIEPMLRFNIPRPMGRFFLLGLGFFVMLVVLKVDPWLAIVGGLAFAYNSNNLILMEAGHVTKLIAATGFPLIFAGLYMLFEKRKYLIGFATTLLGAALNLHGNHVQMTYYFGLAIAIYILIHLIILIVKKENLLNGLLKPAVLSLVALALAVGVVSPNLWSTYEYSKDTMRGDPILEKTIAEEEVEGQDVSSNVKGLSWDYAMQWSNGGVDVLALFIPRAAGGGSRESIGPNAKNYDEYKRYNLRPRGPKRKIQIPLYFGKLPFTVGPTYFGAAVLFLFVFGMFVVEGRMKWWLAGSVLFMILLSYGKNFEFFQRILWNVLPLYNKFRAPNSVMTITGFLIPILGFMGVSRIINGSYDKEKVWAAAKKTTYIVGGFMLLMVLLGGSLINFTNAADEGFQNDQFVDLLIGTRKSLFRLDALRSLFFVLLTAGAIWAFVKNKIKKPLFIAALSLVVLIDLFGVSMRYLDHDSFMPKSRATKVTPRPVDQRILSVEKGRGPYRVLDLSINTLSSASTSYYFNTVGGYHPAKLQRIQDIFDNYFKGAEIPGSILGFLNTKYVIQRDGQLVGGPGFGAAWFVDSLKTVSTPNEEIDALGTTNLQNVAVVLDEEFDNYIAGFQPTKNGTITVEDYRSNKMVYKTTSASEQFAVFSEAWYGPNKGWKVKLDNEEVPHVRADYLLRGLRIPAGEHTVEFYFEPDTYYKATSISTASSALSVVLILGIFGWVLFQRFKNPEPEVEA